MRVARILTAINVCYVGSVTLCCEISWPNCIGLVVVSVLGFVIIYLVESYRTPQAQNPSN